MLPRHDYWTHALKTLLTGPPRLEIRLSLSYLISSTGLPGCERYGCPVIPIRAPYRGTARTWLGATDGGLQLLSEKVLEGLARI
jgi:hypothetical protein